MTRHFASSRTIARRRARLAVEDGHLAEELPAPERRQRPVLAADALGDLHRARYWMTYISSPRLPLAKEHVAGAELAAEAREERIGHAAPPRSVARTSGKSKSNAR